MKRDIINEIVKKNQRNKNKSVRLKVASEKFILIAKCYEHITKDINHELDYRKELLKYIPIAFITLLENYFRDLIKKIILTDNKYFERVAELKNINIDLKTIINAQKASLSIADIVCHLISFSSFENINNNLSILLGQDFIKILSDKVKEKTVFEGLDDSSELIKSIQKIYELRNIFTHEYAFKESIKIKELRELYTKGFAFVILTELAIDQYLKSLTSASTATASSMRSN